MPRLLLYCVKAKPYLLQGLAKPMHTKDTTNPFNYNWDLIEKQTSNALNGKIVAECDFEVEEIKINRYYHSMGDYDYVWDTKSLTYDELLNEACMNNNQLQDYLEFNGYAIHIKNLHIFNEPHRLDDYFILNENPHILEKAPQNMCRVSQRFGGLHSEDTSMQNYILISIRPEWLCKILNGQKTIVVRKKVLKELKNGK